MSWFNDVTGTNDYERQSWRDSYNGGRAAGDLTGNVNARLDQERSDFQGATWSGSSSQYSAIELAQRSSGVGQPAANAGAGASKSSGPGNEVVSQGGVAPSRPAGGSGAASKLSIFGGTAPLKAAVKDSASGGYAGVYFEPNPWFSDVQEWWEPRFGEPGEWLGGLVNIAADAVYNTDRLRKFAGDEAWHGAERGVGAAFDAYRSWGVGGAGDPNPTAYRPMSAW